MAGPWDKYAPVPGTLQPPSAGPWARYGTPLEQVEQTASTSQSPGFWGTVGDVVQSAGTGLVEGAAELGMTLPYTLPRVADRAGYWVSQKGIDAGRWIAGQPSRSAEERETADAEFAAMDAAKYSGQDAARRLMSENLHQPETTAGEFARTATAFVPGAVAVGPTAPLANALRFGVIPGIISEGAGQITEGSPYEGAARLAGGIAGGLVGGLVRSPASYAEAMTGRAAAGVTPQQFRTAEQVVADARAQGIDLTAPEAIQAATGGGTRLGSVMRMVEGTTEGGARTAPFFANRPAQVEAATSRVARQIAPDTATPSYQGQQLRDAAERAMMDLERQRTAASTPFYQRAASDVVPEPEIRGVLQRIDDAIASDQTGIVSGALRDLRQRLIATPARPGAPAERVPITGPDGSVIRYEMRPARPGTPEQPIMDIGNLDRVRKYFRDRLNLPQIGQDAITKEQGAAITSILDDIDRLMLANSGDLAAGRATHQALSESLVNPAAAGPLGRIAGTAEVPGQVEALMPRQPLAGSVPETAYAAQALAGEAPDAARGVVRQGYERDVQRGLFNALGLPDEYGGARVAGLLRQNNREGNALAAIEATAGRDVRDQVERLTDALAATGWRYRPNSATAFNAEMMSGMKEGGVGGLLSSLAKPATAVKDAMNRVRLGRQSERLADLLLSGQPGVRRIAEMAGRANDRPVIDAIVRALLAAPATMTERPALPATR